MTVSSFPCLPSGTNLKEDSISVFTNFKRLLLDSKYSDG